MVTRRTQQIIRYGVSSSVCSAVCVETTSRPPKWIKPQLTRLVDEAPAGGGWVHEIKYDGYRMQARIDDGDMTTATSSC